MKSGTGRGTLGKVRDWSEDPRGGSGRVGGPTGRFGTVRGTVEEVRDGLVYPRISPGRVPGPAEWTGDHLGGPGDLGEVRGTLGKV